MQQVLISDMTMKQSGQGSAFSLTFKEKLELSKLLDRLGVSVIELEGVSQKKMDSLRIKSIAMAVKNCTVAVPVQMDAENIEATWQALKNAKSPRLQVCAPVSTVQMEYLFHKKPAAMLSGIRESVQCCKKYTPHVEFIADDATRSDPAFLFEALQTAIDAGAETITVCDAAGAMLPDEFAAFIQDMQRHVPALSQVRLGVCCSNEMAMADACAMAAIRCGALEIKAASYPVNTVSLPNVSRVLSLRGDAYGVHCSVRTTEMKRIVNQIIWMCQTGRSKHSPFDQGVQDVTEGVALTRHDDEKSVLRAVEKLGYDLSEEDAMKVWEEFNRIAQRKEQVGSKELDAIVAAVAMQVPPAYQVESYTVNTGNLIKSTAYIKMMRQDKVLEGVSLGDGPIDAAFMAVEQIVGTHYELDDFQIQAVTEGREAMGQTVVKLRSEGRVYSGRGISTDIVGASIQAYVNALNKIVYEEEEA